VGPPCSAATHIDLTENFKIWMHHARFTLTISTPWWRCSKVFILKKNHHSLQEKLAQVPEVDMQKLKYYSSPYSKQA
jgi:hypothetical protein